MDLRPSGSNALKPLSPGALLGHYVVQQQIGAGSGGVVYRALDQRLRRAVAVKVLDPSQAPHGTWAAAMQEARAAALLAHANICTVFDVGEEEGQAYLATELVEGRSLDAALPGHGLNCNTAARYGAQIASALAHAHEKGVCHGDVSARNVMLTTDDRVKVLDFGLAWLGAKSISPALPSNPVRRDLQQLGILLCLMTTGIFPPRALDVLSANSPPSAILESQPVAALPQGMRSVISRCLDSDPSRGYQRAKQAAADLEAQALTGNARAAKWRGVALSAAGALLLAALIGIYPLAVWKAHARGAASGMAIAVPADRAGRAPSKAPRRTGRPEVRVWVNTRSKVYHCSSSALYGKTLEGKFMTQQQALAAGDHPAREDFCQ
jgi:aminoglycoside phosphotransferase